MAIALDLRLLHAKSEHGYTANLAEALVDEPEAVSEAEQRYQTRLAKRRESARQLAAWHEIRAALDAALDAAETLRLDVEIGGDLTGIRQRVARLGRRIDTHR